MNCPRLSIIIANLNGRMHLELCLPSLLTQTYPQELVEIIVIDNGSSDDSLAFLQVNYPQVKVIVNTKNEGFAKANNQGANVAIGDLLVLINNDMVAAADWLEQLVKTQKETGAACVGGVILNWDGTAIDFVDAGVTPYGFASQLHYGEPAECLREYGKVKPLFFACGGAMLIRKDVFLELGGFDEDFFAYYEDVDLGFRLWVTGYEVILAPQAITRHRHNGTGKVFTENEKMVLLLRNRLLFIFKNYGEGAHFRVLFGCMLHFFVECCSGVYLFLSRQKQEKGFLESACAQLKAMQGFIEMLPEARAKRAFIQAARKRNDQEIQHLMQQSEAHIAQARKKAYDFLKSLFG